MSNIMDIIKTRRSTRSFKAALPPKADVMKLVEAAEWTPSGMGKFFWHFTVVYNAEKSLRLAKAVAAADNRGDAYNFYGAPVHIILSYKRDDPHAQLDCGAATQTLMLMATELGLGSCWINQIKVTCNDSAVRSILTEYGVPEDDDVMASVAIGYIESETAAKPRKEGVIIVTE